MSSHLMSVSLGWEGSISTDSSLGLWHADAGCIDSFLKACQKIKDMVTNHQQGWRKTMDLQQKSCLCFEQPQIHVPAHLSSCQLQFPQGCDGFVQGLMPQPVFGKKKKKQNSLMGGDFTRLMKGCWCQLGLCSWLRVGGVGWLRGLNEDCVFHCGMTDNQDLLLHSLGQAAFMLGQKKPHQATCFCSLVSSEAAAPLSLGQDSLLQPDFFSPACNGSQFCRFPAPSPAAGSPRMCISPGPQMHAGSSVRDIGLQTSREKYSVQPAPPACSLASSRSCHEACVVGDVIGAHAVYSVVCRRISVFIKKKIKKRNHLLFSVAQKT